MRFSHALLIGGLLLPSALLAQGEVVPVEGPNADSKWFGWTMGPTVSAEINTKNPRLGFGGYGEASLHLKTGGDLNDWAFWFRLASGGTFVDGQILTASYGSIADLTSLSFDWFRVEDAYSRETTNPGGPNTGAIVDWPFKTPVFRVLLAEDIPGVDGAPNQTVRSELVWEGFFNCPDGSGGFRRCGAGDAYTPLDNWNVTGNLRGQNFWYHRDPLLGADPVGNYLISDDCALNQTGVWSGEAVASTIDALFGTNGCFNHRVSVLGVGVGLGSQWPYGYEAFVDNVRMDFTTGGGLDANFDFMPTNTVPEPTTYALMAVGLAAIGAVARRRRRR